MGTRVSISIAVLVSVLAIACKDTAKRRDSERTSTRAHAAPAPGDASPAAGRAGARAEAAPPAHITTHCADAPKIDLLAPGLTLETLRPQTAPAIEVSDPCLRVLRADPTRYRVTLGAALAEAPPTAARTAPDWAERAGAVGVINASMFHAGGASTGLLVDGEHVITGRINEKFGEFFAAGPKAERTERPPVTMWGRGCPGDSLRELRRDYRLVAQNYRLLDCDGGAIRWKDDKVYSVAAVGVDRRGNVLFIHSRAPYLMASFTELLLEPALKLDLAAAMYVEGGPEATLYVRNGTDTALFVGSYESLFVEDDGNQAAWALPNVLMLVPR